MFSSKKYSLFALLSLMKPLVAAADPISDKVHVSKPGVPYLVCQKSVTVCKMQLDVLPVDWASSFKDSFMPYLVIEKNEKEIGISFKKFEERSILKIEGDSAPFEVSTNFYPLLLYLLLEDDTALQNALFDKAEDRSGHVILKSDLFFGKEHTMSEMHIKSIMRDIENLFSYLKFTFDPMLLWAKKEAASEDRSESEKEESESSEWDLV